MPNTSKQKAENAEIRAAESRSSTRNDWPIFEPTYTVIWTQFIRIRALRSFRRYQRYFESRKIGGQSWQRFSSPLFSPVYLDPDNGRGGIQILGSFSLFRDEVESRSRTETRCNYVLIIRSI